MRIEDRYIPSAEPGQTRKATETTGVKESSRVNPQAEKAASEDQVTLSGVANLVEQAKSAGAEDRAATVAQLRAEYEAGKLHVDSADLAEKMTAQILGESE
jgi:flagellar biosynthesis anti-sigma factor FlgM